MNILTLLVSVGVTCLIIMLALWVGIYIVLPLVLCMAFISAIVALIRSFMPKKQLGTAVKRNKSRNDQVIDVEFEEIK